MFCLGLQKKLLLACGDVVVDAAVTLITAGQRSAFERRAKRGTNPFLNSNKIVAFFRSVVPLCSCTGPSTFLCLLGSCWSAVMDVMD